MKLCCTLIVVFICLFSWALFLFFTSVKDDQETIEEPHYMCPAGYELLTEYNPPKCRHYIQKAIEAEKRKEEEEKARRDAWLLKLLARSSNTTPQAIPKRFP